MYYEEKIINGILHWRGAPDDEWTAYTPEQLTEKHRGATFQRDALQAAIHKTIDYFNGREYEMGDRCIEALKFIKDAVGRDSE